MDTKQATELKDTTPKPKKRIWSLDFAKGFALIFVVIIHILDNLSSTQVQQSGFAYTIFVIGRLVGAVVFMFLMGVALTISSRSDLKGGIKRGLEVMLIGYVLNFFRGTLPVWVSIQRGIYTLEEVAPQTPLYLLREFDILPFAGFALIILVTMKHFLRKPLYWLIAGLVVAFLTPVLRNLSPGTGLPVIDLVLSHFWSREDPIYFSILPWLAYPLFGMVYGHYLIKAENKPKFLWKTVFMGFILMAVCTPMLFINPGYKTLDLHSTFFAFRRTAIGAIWYAGFVPVWLALCYLLVEKIPGNFLFRRLYYWSKNVTSIYCIQWIIIGWIVTDASNLSLGTTVMLMVGIIIATDLLTVFWNRVTADKK